MRVSPAPAELLVSGGPHPEAHGLRRPSPHRQVAVQSRHRGGHGRWIQWHRGVAGVHFVEPGVKVNSAYYCEQAPASPWYTSGAPRGRPAPGLQLTSRCNPAFHLLLATEAAEMPHGRWQALRGVSGTEKNSMTLRAKKDTHKPIQDGRSPSISNGIQSHIVFPIVSR